MTTVIRQLLSSFPVIGKPASLQAKRAKNPWRIHVAKTAQTYQKKPFDSDVKLDLQIDWFSQDSRNRADVDNISKPISDALKNIIYIDDKQLSSVSAKHHDLNSVLTFINEPVHIIEPLLDGEKEYVYIRAYRAY